MGLAVSRPAATFLINFSSFSSNQAFTSFFFYILIYERR